MKPIYILLLSLVLGACATTAKANCAGDRCGKDADSQPITLHLDKNRTIAVTGVIGTNALAMAAEIEKMSLESKRPIYLVINSPGGSVITGLQMISAMNLAQQRGVKFHCMVPVMAASMAFQFLAECDYRYAFNYALLLWHPIRVNVFMKSITPKVAKQMYQELKYWEKPLIKRLREKLNISKRTFYRHYHKETLHTAAGLESLDAKFLTIVEDVKNHEGLFDLRK